MADHLPARPHGRFAHGAGADRGRALWRRLRHRAIQLPHPAPASQPAGGPRDRGHPDRGPAFADPRTTARAGAEGVRGAGQGDLRQVPFHARHASHGRGSRRAGAEPHLASDPLADRHGRDPAHGERGQRAAAVHCGQAVDPPAADLRRQGGRGGGEAVAGGRSPLWCGRQLRDRLGRGRLERAGPGSLAGGGCGQGFARGLRA